ncbi:MAG: hypothetical protein AAF718_10420 [Pseudomonadota bacterium]
MTGAESKKPKIKLSVIFSLLIFLGVVILYGSSIQSLFFSIFILFTANIIFRVWEQKNYSEAIKVIAIKSILLLIVLFVSFILWIKIMTPGQAGYGERLLFKGGSITPLGYKALFQQASMNALVVFISAVCTATIYMKGKKND